MTPDSSRNWDAEEWKAAAAKGKSPSGFDKEPVRQWGKSVMTPFGVTLDKLNTENGEHLEWVASSLEVQEEIISATTDRYRKIFQRLTRRELEEFQLSDMKVAAA